MTNDELSDLNSEHSGDSKKARAAMMDTMMMVEIYNAIQNRDNAASLTIPHRAKHTYYTGSCCGVNHVLMITIKTSGGVTDPFVIIPLQIGTMEVQKYIAEESTPMP